MVVWGSPMAVLSADLLAVSKKIIARSSLPHRDSYLYMAGMLGAPSLRVRSGATMRPLPRMSWGLCMAWAS